MVSVRCDVFADLGNYAKSFRRFVGNVHRNVTHNKAGTYMEWNLHTAVLNFLTILKQY